MEKYMSPEQARHIKLAKEYMKEHNITQKKLAEEIKITPGRLSYIMNNSSDWFNSSFSNFTTFFRNIETDKNKNNNFERYGFNITDDAINLVKDICKEIEKSIANGEIKINIRYDFNLYENSETIMFIKNYDIDVIVENHSKTGHFTDSHDEVNIFIDLNNENIKKILEDVQKFYL